MNDHLNQSVGLANFWLVIKRSARRFEIGLFMGLLLIGPIMGFSYYSLRQLDEARKVQEHSLIVREHLNDLRSAVRQYEILYLRDAPEEARGESRLEIDTILNALSQSVEADEIQTESLTEVRAVIAEFVAEPTPEYSQEVREWILSMDAQEADFLMEHRPAAVQFLSSASGSILLVGILSLILSLLAFLGLRRQMRSREILEDELRAAERQATRASEMKSKFLATISHEIRTPLNGIIAMTDLMRSSSLPAKEKRFTEIIHQSGQALLRIINDLLDFSQIEAGQTGLEVKAFSIPALLEQTCLVLDLKASAKGLSLRRNVGADVPISVQGDAGRLGQVLFNLIGNAIKFTSAGSIEISVEKDPASTEEVARVNFRVKDTGRGIPEGELETLFQPFRRSGQVGVESEPGTGLGLSIAQSLVRQMGGEIRVESRHNQGSVFWFQLPLPMAKASEDKLTMPVAMYPAVDVFNRFPDVRVLVVEDNETNQIVAESVLQQMGCRVTVASNGLDALAALANLEFDLVLMDCQMPAMDGYETTRKIREQELRGKSGKAFITAMTANAQADDRARCLAAGMDDYISKPFVIDDLVRVLSKVGHPVERSILDFAQSDLRARLGDASVLRLRGVFRRSLEEWPQQSSQGTNERQILKETAHKLKSSARTMGAVAFADRLERLETLLQNDPAPEFVAAEVSQLKTSIDRDVETLREYFAD